MIVRMTAAFVGLAVGILARRRYCADRIFLPPHSSGPPRLCPVHSLCTTPRWRVELRHDPPSDEIPPDAGRRTHAAAKQGHGHGRCTSGCCFGGGIACDHGDTRSGASGQSEGCPTALSKPFGIHRHGLCLEADGTAVVGAGQRSRAFSSAERAILHQNKTLLTVEPAGGRPRFPFPPVGAR